MAGISAACLCVLLGCGMAAAPQPPSLHLPMPVKDLAATRTGSEVQLQWTSPKQTTDKVKLTAPVQFQICRQIGTTPCQTVGSASAEPGKPDAYVDHLPASLISGPLRAVNYQVLGINDHKKNAGPSNGAATLLGAAPPVVTGLTATMLERGVVLHWQPVSGLPADTQILLERTLLTPQKTAKDKSAIPAVSEAQQQSLAVSLGTGSKDPGAAIDTSVQFGQKYRYVASRMVKVNIAKTVLQAASTPSQPTDIETRDTFPPAAPTGLAAVPISAAMTGGQPEIDLSWSSNTEPDLAQYRVYRRDLSSSTGAASSTAIRIAPANASEPVVGPAFRDLHVGPGHTYAYSVTAVDDSGNESAKSAEVLVTLPSD